MELGRLIYSECRCEFKVEVCKFDSIFCRIRKTVVRWIYKEKGKEQETGNDKITSVKDF